MKPTNSQLEDYLRGVPLTEELGNLAATGADRPASGGINPPPGAGPRRPATLSAEDREWLRRLTTEPGWIILLHTLDASLARHTQDAIALSEHDPIANASQIIKAWTYVKSFREVYAEILQSTAANSEQQPGGDKG